MNPYESILNSVYGDECEWSDMHGMDSAAILVLRILADNYKGDMPARYLLRYLQVVLGAVEQVQAQRIG